jgi:gliding-associated putative ABC transporter substrate-binding component GldG
MLLGVVIAVNLLALFFFARLDITDTREYSLSEASKEMARALDDPVIARLYFSEDLPYPYNLNSRYLRDILYEYRAYSGRNLRFEFVDPVKTDREVEARGMGIPAMQVNVIEKDKYELKKVYMGVAFLYEDKREVIPFVQSRANLEYELSSAIRKVTADSLPVVGFLTGHSENSFTTNLQIARQALQQLYEVQTVSITPGVLIPGDITTLVIAGPRDSVGQWDQYAIDQFVMRGGHLGVFYDPVIADMQLQTAASTQANWLEFLRHYGMAVNENLVLDAACSEIAVMEQQGLFTIQNRVRYPFIPNISDFNNEHLIGKDLQGVLLPFVSSLDSAAAQDAGLTFQWICRSSERTGVRRAPYYVSALQEFVQSQFTESPQVLAAAVTGVFHSIFPTGPPLDPAADGTTPADHLSTSVPSRMVIVGDADFCTDQAMRSPSNVSFFMNIVDWLTQDERLITIRSRNVTTRKLDEVSDAKRRTVKYANIFGPPLFVICVGLWRWQSRRRMKRGSQIT